MKLICIHIGGVVREEPDWDIQSKCAWVQAYAHFEISEGFCVYLLSWV